MNDKIINGTDLKLMVEIGAKRLTADKDRINSLNVFPVPDGDTGTNMAMTIDGGANVGDKNTNSIGEISKDIARAMVLSARGNSGVILSQFFKGLSLALEDKFEVTVEEFAKAMISGTKKSYSVVSNPTEGTILTVMREAGELAYNELNSNTTLEQYFESYLKHANISLAKTPELLPVLKKAGVIDSGGAGFILVIEGMLKAIRGEEIISSSTTTSSTKVDTSGFNADSELTYGYCTEFILQLQNSKVNVKTFDLDIITNYLNSIGDSVVSFKDDDIVKVHVHTFDPGQVLTECRKYGEFLTIKIENMNVGHFESNDFEEPEVETEHKEYAMVAVASGKGIEESFLSMGVDVVVSGGQTMNTSCEDFIKAFDKINATNIFVYPNNGNILMAAKQAEEVYTKANIVVIPTKTLAQGYSAISMFEYESNDLEQIVEAQLEVIRNVSTLEVTYSVRDTNINDIEIKKGDYICLYDNELVSCNPNRLEALKEAIKTIEDFEDKQVLTVLYGMDVNQEELSLFEEYVQEINSFIELYPIEGKQDIYSYIIGIE